MLDRCPGFFFVTLSNHNLYSSTLKVVGSVPMVELRPLQLPYLPKVNLVEEYRLIIRGSYAIMKNVHGT